MNIQVAVLCDAATEDNGKLNLLGDEGEHKLKLNFVNADGHAIMPPIEIPVSVVLPDDVHFLTRNFIVNIQQLKFAEEGLYSVDVRLDEVSQAGIPLSVKHMPPAEAA